MVNYDSVSWFYDKAARMLFGNALSRAQNCFLAHINPGSSILIAGGGTGEILEQLAAQHSSGLQIQFVELSSCMLEKAKRRKYGRNTVIFTHSAVEDLPAGMPYDLILTGFLFDNFDKDGATKIFRHLDLQLRPLGLWINTDFQLTGAVWQKLLLKGMYLFFMIFSELNTSSLPPMDDLFDDFTYIKQKETCFYGDFIGSRLYLKPF